MKTVLLLFGGESPEHDVSLNSARNVFSALDKDRYDVVRGYVSRDGTSWRAVRSFDDLDGPELLPLPGKGAVMIADRIVTIDVVLPILHGVHGEDGDIQGFARLLHVPCAGPGVLGAALTMDKDLTKRVVRDAGVPVVPWRLWMTGDTPPVYDDIRAALGPVVFVKPSRTGSSVGVSKATSLDEFIDALALAASYDTHVLIETAIAGREIELAVLGNDDPAVTAPGEIIPGEEFYSYDDKYSAGSASRAVIPAPLGPETIERLRAFATTAYRAVRGRGMARVDFFVTDDGTIYLNEINAIPGFTDISMYPKLWEHEGKTYPELIDDLLSLAL